MWNLPADFDDLGSDGEWIEIRTSQHKCDVRPHLYTFDVVRRSTPSNGGSIGPQALAVLRRVNESQECRAAIEEALERLREAAGMEVEQSLLDERDAATLISALDKSCQRSSETAIGALRVNSHKYAEEEDVEIYENDLKTYDVHPLSGRPTQWEAQVKMLLLAGFPTDHPVVQGRLQRIKEILVKQAIEAKCPVPRSRHAFAIVDHTGTLQADQVFFQSSVHLQSSFIQIHQLTCLV